MRDVFNDELFELEKIHTDHNESNMLTKNLLREKLEFCCSLWEWQVPPQSEIGGDLLGLFHIIERPNLRSITWAK